MLVKQTLDTKKLWPEHNAATKQSTPLQCSQHKPNKGGEREEKFSQIIVPFPRPTSPKNYWLTRKDTKKIKLLIEEITQKN